MHTTRSVLAVEVTPSAGERGFRWVFHPADAISPRATFKPLPEGYGGNPPAEVKEYDGVTAAVQPLLAGGQHVTAWRERTRGAARTLYVNVAHSHPGTTARDRAVRAVRSAAGLSYDGLAASHRAWWHAYYRKSFLSLPDARMQRFYWIQLYKTAAAARRDAPVMATCGPWLEPTPWPNTWWNLNVQLEYWLIHGSNHLELDAVTRALSEFRSNLTKEMAAPYRADSLGIPRTTDPSLVNGASVTDGGYGVGIPGQDPPPNSQGAGGTPNSRGGQPHVGSAQRLAELPPHHGQVDPARRALPAPAQGDQLLPALPGAGRGRQVAPPGDVLA
ncbi:hypothetical protein [Streptomyces sp. NPDC055243]|uniref:hypothetical protein n=1 Tax=Streptomyces sp. NPDC055243 TaxID=3365720 RepID=UPI0037D0F084